MRWFSIVIAILFLSPIVMAKGDLKQYSYSEYDSQKHAPILVEWFHGEGDEEYVSTLEEMHSAGEITLIHWRTGAEEEGGGWPDDDADSRAMFHEIENFPAMTIDGYVASIEEIDSIDTNEHENEVSIDYSIELVGSSKVELISIIAEWENPQAMKNVTQLHVFIVESESTDSKGRSAQNLLRDWAPSTAFNVSSGATNKWNTTITRDHLEGAGIELGDASHASEYELILVMIGGFENDTNNRVLSLQQTSLPTSWHNTDASGALIPGLILGGMIFCIGFIVMAERKREIGLPKLEGVWKDEEGELEYRLVAGYSLEIGKMTLDEGWRSNSRIKKGRVKANEIQEGLLKVRGEGAFHMRLAVTVDELGEWILDLNLPEQKLKN